MERLDTQLQNTVLNNFIDKDKYLSSGNLSADLILNHNERDNVYRVLKMELATCEEFTFAVAFITHAGLAQFLTVLKDLEKRGIKGRILTSTYLYFNKPEVFRALKEVKNVETRIFEERDRDTNQELPFHAKGYLFKHQNYQSAIIGSSNLTAPALLKNYEWNLCVNSLENAEITDRIRLQINAEWEKATPLTDEWCKDYSRRFKKWYQQNQSYQVSEVDNKEITANRMQKAAIDQLVSLRQTDIKKALVVSATGTGKTYLAALDVKKVKPKRFLYVAHREQILEKSLLSFYRVLGGDFKDFGIISGNRKDGLNTKYVFATVQSLAKDDILKQFDPSDFDYILFDEAHHLGASQQLKVFNYFKPDFCLGITATPERSDDFNIYKLFDYNIAYEIRLQDALKEDMLCPFRYFGVEDYIYQDKIIEGSANLARLVSDERVDYILQQTKYYGYSGEVLHGLIFCSSVDEAKELAEKISQRGYRAKAIFGSDSISQREQAVKDLESGILKYIVTVDVFNEGVDIPCVNQIVLLRNTQSSIVFVQQLGRGLRKAKDKDYLTVIDFVGNYSNNYLIPIALTGDKSHNKDSVRDKVDLEPLFGISVINFTNIAKERIYRSINQTNLTLKRKLREEYLETKRKLGRIPLLTDLQKDSIDCQVIAKKYKSYATFLAEMGEDSFKINTYQNQVLAFITSELSNGMRQHELLLLDYLLEHSNITITDYCSLLKQHNCLVNDEILTSVKQILSLDFYERKAKPNKASYGGINLIEEDDDKLTLSDKLRFELNSKEFLTLFRDVISAGLFRSEKYNSKTLFTINQRYTRMDACRLLGWQKIVPGQNIGGYKFDEATKTCAIFITYEKNKDANVLAYPDKFISPSVIKMFSKYPRKLDSKEIQKFKQNYQFHLFIQKSDDDGASFIYLGTCKPDLTSFDADSLQILDKKNQVQIKPVVSMNLRLDQAVDLNEYYMLTKIRY